MVNTVTLSEATGPADDNVNITAADGSPDVDGFYVVVRGGQGGASASRGGHVDLSGGDASDGSGGTITLSSGQSSGGGNGGTLIIEAGNGLDGAGGDLIITSGLGGANAGGELGLTAGNGLGGGGNITMTAGDARSGGDANGGNVVLQPGAKDGSGTVGHIVITLGFVSDFADDAAAATGGVPVGGLYRTASVIKIRVS